MPGRQDRSNAADCGLPNSVAYGPITSMRPACMTAMLSATLRAEGYAAPRPVTAVVRGLHKEIVMPSTLQTRRGFMGLSLLGLGLAGTALAQKTYGPGAHGQPMRRRQSRM